MMSNYSCPKCKNFEVSLLPDTLPPGTDPLIVTQYHAASKLHHTAKLCQEQFYICLQNATYLKDVVYVKSCKYAKKMDKSEFEKLEPFILSTYDDAKRNYESADSETIHFQNLTFDAFKVAAQSYVELGEHYMAGLMYLHCDDVKATKSFDKATQFPPHTPQRKCDECGFIFKVWVDHTIQN